MKKQVNVKFIFYYITTKMSYFTNAKDSSVSVNHQSYIKLLLYVAVPPVLVKLREHIMKEQKNMPNVTKIVNTKAFFMNIFRHVSAIIIFSICLVL